MQKLINENVILKYMYFTAQFLLMQYVYGMMQSFLHQVCARVSTFTTLGYIADDPTDAKDLGDAAKRYYDAGTDTSCKGSWTPKCCPLFTVNEHVIDWLMHPDRDRYVMIILFLTLLLRFIFHWASYHFMLSQRYIHFISFISFFFLIFLVLNY